MSEKAYLKKLQEKINKIKIPDVVNSYYGNKQVKRIATKEEESTNSIIVRVDDNNDNFIGIEYYSYYPNGNLDYLDICNEKAVSQQTIFFQKNGETIDQIQEYKNNIITKITFYRKDKTIKQIKKYENGKKTRTTFYQKDGKTKDHTITYDKTNKKIIGTEAFDVTGKKTICKLEVKKNKAQTTENEQQKTEDKIQQTIKAKNSNNKNFAIIKTDEKGEATFNKGDGDFKDFIQSALKKYDKKEPEKQGGLDDSIGYVITSYMVDEYNNKVSKDKNKLVCVIPDINVNKYKEDKQHALDTLTDIIKNNIDTFEKEQTIVIPNCFITKDHFVVTTITKKGNEIYINNFNNYENDYTNLLKNGKTESIKIDGKKYKLNIHNIQTVQQKYGTCVATSPTYFSEIMKMIREHGLNASSALKDDNFLDQIIGIDNFEDKVKKIKKTEKIIKKVLKKMKKINQLKKINNEDKISELQKMKITLKKEKLKLSLIATKKIYSKIMEFTKNNHICKEQKTFINVYDIIEKLDNATKELEKTIQEQKNSKSKSL